jgi:hypothetical protein
MRRSAHARSTSTSTYKGCTLVKDSLSSIWPTV